MGDQSVDYRNLSLPTDKPPSEYSYQERRADILQNYILDKGHPDAVNWSELARYYDKSKSTLHNDKETLTEWIVADLDVGRVSGIASALFEQGLLEIQADDDYDAFDYHSFVSRWVGTLDKLGVLDLEEADEEDPFSTGGDGEGITVSISGVSADDVDASDLPKQDRPDDEEEEQEEVPA